MGKHLIKQHKFFYFQTRIFWNRSASMNDQRQCELWESTLKVLSELCSENEMSVYGLVYDAETLHILFSTPDFNENILILDWELRLKVKMSIKFDRPITCEPLSGLPDLKVILIDIYRSQCEIYHNSIRWRHPFNSLKLIIEGHRQAKLFKDPLQVVFQPQVVFRIGKQASNTHVF